MTIILWSLHCITICPCNRTICTRSNATFDLPPPPTDAYVSLHNSLGTIRKKNDDDSINTVIPSLSLPLLPDSESTKTDNNENNICIDATLELRPPSIVSGTINNGLFLTTKTMPKTVPIALMMLTSHGTPYLVVPTVNPNCLLNPFLHNQQDITIHWILSLPNIQSHATAATAAAKAWWSPPNIWPQYYCSSHPFTFQLIDRKFYVTFDCFDW